MSILIWFYDSWVTIGLQGTPDLGAGEAGVSTVQSTTNPWETNFDPGGGLDGGDIVIDDEIGGAWYALNGQTNGVAGDDFKVLIGQFVTTGTFEVEAYVQIFVGGVGANEILQSFYYPDTVDPVLGCTDSTACNYDEAADTDDGSCTYPANANEDCDGNCLNDVNDNGICDETEQGCTNSSACNYDPTAVIDDGSCVTDCIGCPDPLACNYGGEAITEDDGSCTYPANDNVDCDGNCFNDINDNDICDEDEVFGCTEMAACNFDSTATANDGSCFYPYLDYLDCDGNCLNDGNGDGVCDEEEGCSDENACNYDSTAAITPADYCLIVDTVAVHPDSSDLDVAGMTTYRLYLRCATPTAYVSAIFGDAPTPSSITTTTNFYQDALGGPTPDFDASLIAGFPSLQFDSYLTIGMTSAPDVSAGEDNLLAVGAWAATFDPGFGALGGNVDWTAFPGGSVSNFFPAANGFAANHPNNEVLLAQLTTDGEIEGNLHVQIWPDGIQPVNGGTELLLNFTIGEVCAAPDPDCLYPEDIYDGADNVDCGGNCLNDADGDGYCDEDEVPGCMDQDSYTFDSAATDMDSVACLYAAASVYDIIADSEVHTTLESLVDAAGLAGELTDGGPWTVFAPTDAAVNALDPDQVSALLADPVLLYNVLTYHVHADSLVSDDFSDGQGLTMLNEDMATVGVQTDADGTTYTIDGIDIIILDLIADNGVVHVIDMVMGPEVEGCSNGLACNDNPWVTIPNEDDCDFETCYGCTDPTACNYDSLAVFDPLPSVCEYPEPLLDCDGNCLNDVDGDLVCDELEVLGCTVDGACNFNPSATDNDGTCEFVTCAGCTDSLACNYDSLATYDPGNLCLSISDVCGGDVYSNCDCECNNDVNDNDICDEFEESTCHDPAACNYDTSGIPDVTVCDYTSCLGCTEEGAVNYDPTASIDDESCLYCDVDIMDVDQISVVDVTCGGAMDGSITIEGTIGNYGPFTFALEDGGFQSSTTFGMLSGGSYKIYAMDTLMCLDTVEVFLNEPDPLVLQAFTNDVSCNGAADGVVVASAQGGTGDVLFELGGESNADGDFQGLDAGPYTVFATDDNGCEADFSVEVEEPDAIVIEADEVTDPDGAPNGSISISVEGGTPEYTFAWTGPDNAQYDSEDINGLTDGTYTVTVTDENECEATETFVLTTVGLTVVSGDLGIALMPNPTDGQLTLELNQLVDGAIIEVFDGAGRRVFRQEGMTLSGKVQMDFSALSDGVYQVRLTAGTSSAMQQLMIRH